MEELLQAALDHATFAGASYTDVRAVEIESETLSVTGPSVEALDTGYSLGFGVRVLADGAWGHAASAKLEPSEFERVAQSAVEVARAAATAVAAPVELVPEPVHRARWATPVVLDPWRVPLEDKPEVLTSAAGGRSSSAPTRPPPVVISRGGFTRSSRGWPGETTRTPPPMRRPGCCARPS